MSSTLKYGQNKDPYKQRVRRVSAIKVEEATGGWRE
jgi:hypothetical protein